MSQPSHPDWSRVRIEPVAQVVTPRMIAEVDEVFFTSSGTQTFATPADRAAFRERWLGRYLRAEGDHAFVAIEATGAVVGYLVGALTDPATGDTYRDIGYFPLLAEATARYPAHLHVNVAAAYRGHGIGERLVAAFAAHAAEHAAPGVHVITGAGARNVGFYARCGFAEVHQFDWIGRPLVMLGRLLLPSAPALPEKM